MTMPEIPPTQHLHPVRCRRHRCYRCYRVRRCLRHAQRQHQHWHQALPHHPYHPRRLRCHHGTPTAARLATVLLALHPSALDRWRSRRQLGPAPVLHLPVTAQRRQSPAMAQPVYPLLRLALRAVNCPAAGSTRGRIENCPNYRPVRSHCLAAAHERPSRHPKLQRAWKPAKN